MICRCPQKQDLFFSDRRIEPQPEALLLEQHMEAAKRITNSFYFPKENRLNWRDAAGHMTNLMQNYGCQRSSGKRFSKRIRTSKPEGSYSSISKKMNSVPWNSKKIRASSGKGK